MRNLLALIISISGGAAVAVADVPTCVGPQDAPVKVIFLHSLDKQLDRDNLKKLEELAKKEGFRVAAPRSRIKNGMAWDYKDPQRVARVLSDIEQDAAAGCHVKKDELASPRQIYGFSNGGYMARSIANLSCDQLADYSLIFGKGAPLSALGSRPRQAKPETGKCNGIYRDDEAHVVPQVAELQRQLGILQTTQVAGPRPSGSNRH